MASFSAPCAVARAALVTMVWQKMLAVSARGMGVWRCIGVRRASCTLW